jgi:hypothetical protein
LAALLVLGGCRSAPPEPSVVHVAEAATLELPAVPNAPSRLQVLQYGVEAGSESETGQCAYLVLDSLHHVEWRIEASEAWEDTVSRGDTLFIRHKVIGDYVPAYRTFYGMQPDQVIKVDCAAYGVLGLARSGG